MANVFWQGRQLLNGKNGFLSFLLNKFKKGFKNSNIFVPPESVYKQTFVKEKNINLEK